MPDIDQRRFLGFTLYTPSSSPYYCQFTDEEMEAPLEKYMTISNIKEYDWHYRSLLLHNKRA